MCAYKLVTAHFKWWGLQGRVENAIMNTDHRLFTVFHRQARLLLASDFSRNAIRFIKSARQSDSSLLLQLFCTIDKWHGLTIEDIRKIEDETTAELQAVHSSPLYTSIFITAAFVENQEQGTDRLVAGLGMP